jgi:hypothetical protein
MNNLYPRLLRQCPPITVTPFQLLLAINAQLPQKQVHMYSAGQTRHKRLSQNAAVRYIQDSALRDVPSQAEEQCLGGELESPNAHLLDATFSSSVVEHNVSREGIVHLRID